MAFLDKLFAAVPEGSRLSELPNRLKDLGVDSARLLAEFLGDEPVPIVLEVLGIEVGGLSDEEMALLNGYLIDIANLSRVEKRARDGQTHLDDALHVTRRKREVEGEPGKAAAAVAPLPGLKAGRKRVGAKTGSGSTGIAEQDRVQRDRWNCRLQEALVRVDAPSVRE